MANERPDPMTPTGAPPAEPRRALLLGATGLTGGHLLRLLLSPESGYRQVIAPARRPLDSSDPRLTTVALDLADPAALAPYVAVDDVFCCLGTTIKKAGSQAAFRHVDHDLPLAAARAARAAGAQRYLLVSAVGADAKSRIFYNRVKGELEDALSALGFPGGVDIARPSLLLGDRGESRPAERAASFLMSAAAPLFRGGLRRYQAIPAASVAAALYHAARRPPAPGRRVYEGEPLFTLAEGHNP